MLAFGTQNEDWISTYVDIKIGIVNVKTVSSLLEVEVRDAVFAGVVVGRQAELSIGGLSSNKVGGRLFSSSAGPQSWDGRVRIDFGGVLVLGLDNHAEFVKVNGSSRERVRAVSVRVGNNTLDGGHGGQGGDESRTHLENERLGMRKE